MNFPKYVLYKRNDDLPEAFCICGAVFTEADAIKICRRMDIIGPDNWIYQKFESFDDAPMIFPVPGVKPGDKIVVRIPTFDEKIICTFNGILPGSRASITVDQINMKGTIPMTWILGIRA